MQCSPLVPGASCKLFSRKNDEGLRIRELKHCRGQRQVEKEFIHYLRILLAKGDSLFTTFASFSISNSVSDGAANKSVLNIDRA